MDPLEDLLETLKAHPAVKAFKQLEKSIFSDEKRKRDYETLCALQKKMVRSEAMKTPTRETDRKHYDAAFEKIADDPLIVQYLSLQDDVNELLSNIVSLIEAGVSGPIDSLIDPKRTNKRRP